MSQETIVMVAISGTVSFFVSGWDGTGPGWTLARGTAIGLSMAFGYCIARYFHG